VSNGCPPSIAEETRKAKIAFEKMKVHEEEDPSLEHADNKRTKKVHGYHN